ncbi:hypothetical protein, partial [Microbacterium sp. BH-3-3-3]|uniref:hypothetical protein n=1 Tax=Microbacterium sp. BH-3-3-3 TaxID=1906742 RepID=UPI001C930CF2
MAEPVEVTGRTEVAELVEATGRTEVAELVEAPGRTEVAEPVEATGRTRWLSLSKPPDPARPGPFDRLRDLPGRAEVTARAGPF